MALFGELPLAPDYAASRKRKKKDESAFFLCEFQFLFSWKAMCPAWVLPATVVSGCQSHIYSTPTEQASHFHGSWTRNVSPNSSTFLGVASLAMVFFGKRGWPTGFHQFHLAENWLGDHHDPPWSTILKDHERSKPMSSSSSTNKYVCICKYTYIYICVLYIHMYIILRKYAVFFWPAVSYTFGEIRQ